MSDMALGMTERLKPIHERVARMVRDEIMPLDEEFLAEVGKEGGDRWAHTDAPARDPRRAEGQGQGARPVEFLADRLRARLWPEHRRIRLSRRGDGQGASRRRDLQLLGARHRQHGGAGTLRLGAHKQQWLAPLLEGKIRSAYLMTEPDVASSDATNIAMRCERDGDDYVLNGEKWWASGAGDPRCAIYIVMVRTGGDGPRHQQHSMILVPSDTHRHHQAQADEGLWRRRCAARPHAPALRECAGARATI